jgi:hypothetical protein
MVDRYVAEWWNENKDRFQFEKDLKFHLSYKRITKSENNWYAYIYWACFCNEISKTIATKYQIVWRPRDIEMAVFQARQDNIELEIP